MIYHTFSDLFLNAKRFRSLNFLDLPVVSGWVSTTRESIWKGVGALQSEFVWGGLCMCYTWVLGLKKNWNESGGPPPPRDSLFFWVPEQTVRTVLLTAWISCCRKGKADKNVWESKQEAAGKSSQHLQRSFCRCISCWKSRVSLLLLWFLEVFDQEMLGGGWWFLWNLHTRNPDWQNMMSFTRKNTQVCCHHACCLFGIFRKPRLDLEL